MVHRSAHRWLAALAIIVCSTLMFAAAANAAESAATGAPEAILRVSGSQEYTASELGITAVMNISSSTLAQGEIPSVTVNDQPITDNTITVDEVIAPQDGWAVIHTLDAQGSPIANQVVGTTQVSAGTNTNVDIELTESFQPGDQLQVMLHIDEGTMGTLEFPGGPDTPVAVDGQIVASNFTVQEAGAQTDGEQQDDQAQASPSPSTTPAQMPNTGIGDAAIPALLMLGGLFMIGAGVLRHVSFRPGLR